MRTFVRKGLAKRESQEKHHSQNDEEIHRDINRTLTAFAFFSEKSSLIR